MAYPVFTWRPLFETPSQIKFNTAEIKLGDGYKQSVGLGINSKSESWNLTFKRMKAEIEEIAAFLDERQGAKIFQWLPKNSLTPKYFDCSEGYRIINHNNGVYTLTATFNQRFLP